MPKNFNLLISRGFLLGLALLLLNDLFLKEALGNWFTGKLSDFSGLFIFPLFWLAIFPRRRTLIFTLTAVLFLWWKSPLSQGFIDGWNTLGILNLGRVVDYSDWLALGMLPLAWWYSGQPHRTVRVHPVLALFVASFAFLATSYEDTFIVEPPQVSNFDYSLDSLKKRMYLLPVLHFYDTGYNQIALEPGSAVRRRFISDSLGYDTLTVAELVKDSMTVYLQSDFCQTANIRLNGDSLRASLTLYWLTTFCEGRTTLNQQLNDFNASVIRPLQE